MFVLFYLFGVLVCLGTGQQRLRARVGPWTHRIQWENNGQVYSLLSTGTQYRLPAQTRRRDQLLLRANNQVNPPAASSRPARTGSWEFNELNGHFQQNEILGADADQYILALGRPGTRSQSPPRSQTTTYSGSRRSQSSSSSALTSVQEFSGSGVPRGGRSTLGDDTGAQRASASQARSPDFTNSRSGRSRSQSTDSAVRSPATSIWVTTAEDAGNARRITQETALGDAPSARGVQRAHTLTRVTPELIVSPTPLYSNAVELQFPRSGPDASRTTDASDPRDPHSIHHRNSVFYNVYPPDRRNRLSARPPPGTGYGTRFFHNGETEAPRQGDQRVLKSSYGEARILKR